MLFWMLACRDVEEGSESPSSCQGWTHAQFGGPEGIRTAQDGCGEVLLTEMRVLGEGSFALDLYTDGTRVIPKVTSLADGGVFRGLAMSGGFELVGDAPLVVWRQGFASSSPAGVFEAGPVQLDDQGVPVVGEAPDDEQPGTSWWAGLVAREDGAAVLIGAWSARATRFSVAFDQGGTAYATWGHEEQILLDDGDAAYLDGLFMAVGADPQELWRTWADEVASSAAVALPGPPPIGWTSAPDPTEAAVRAGLDAALTSNAAPGRAPLSVLQVGDGWANAWGDWTAGPELPSGSAALAAELAAAGFAPGLAIAPFHVDRSTSTWAEHPDWFLRGSDGQELDDLGHALLDVTHPDAATWLSELVAARVGEGWGYLEILHAQAAAREAVRATPSSGVAAYAVAMELVREAAGPDTWIAASDAPLLPSVAFVDSVRLGDPAVDRAGLRERAARVGALGFLNGRTFWVDPGGLSLASFDPAGAHGAVVGTAVAGGPWLVAGDLPSVPDAQLALALTEAVGAAGVDVRPADPLRGAVPWGAEPPAPGRWVLGNGWTALLSLGEAPVALEGPGGTEILDGETAPPGLRTLAPGDGELWR